MRQHRSRMCIKEGRRRLSSIWPARVSTSRRKRKFFHENFLEYCVGVISGHIAAGVACSLAILLSCLPLSSMSGFCSKYLSPVHISFFIDSRNCFFH
ncbi:hypothetical protein AtEden1_Chr1g0040201 [Arabidopsis thaliana]